MNRTRIVGLLGSVILFTAFVGSSAAMAQALTEDSAPDNFQRDRSVGVMDRKRPGYDAMPVHVGGLDLYASATAGMTYDDNILARPDLKEGDEIGVLGAAAKLLTDWPSNSLELDAHAEHDGNVNHDSESETTGGASAQGVVDVSHGLHLRGRVGLDHLFESRLDSGAPTITRRPVEYNRAIAEIAVSQTFNRLRLQLEESHRLLHYDNAETPDGIVVPQGYRNEDRDRITARADYAVSPDTALFVQAIGNFRNYGSRTGLTTDLNRDSKGAEVTGGVSLDLPRLISGEASLGYITQTFTDPRIPNASGFGARGRIELFPTGLTTITVDAQREFSDSALSTSPLVLYTSSGIQLDHELLRNVILSARFNYEEDQYVDVSRTDKRPSATFAVIYMMNRWMKWNLKDTFLYQNSTSGQTGLTYTDNQVSLYLTANY